MLIKVAFILVIVVIAAIAVLGSAAKNDPSYRAHMAELHEISQMRNELMDYYSNQQTDRLVEIQNKVLAEGFGVDRTAEISSITRECIEFMDRVAKMSPAEVRAEHRRIFKR